MKNNIQILRENLGYSQVDFANILNIPVKSIRNWEHNIRIPSDYIIELITDVILRKENDKYLVKNNGGFIPSFLSIKEKVKSVASNYDIEKIYLYGSYAKGKANLMSDIDLFMISNIDGLDYFGLIEKLRSSLNKTADLLSNKTVNKDSNIEKEIMRTGILIYER